MAISLNYISYGGIVIRVKEHPLQNRPTCQLAFVGQHIAMKDNCCRSLEVHGVKHELTRYERMSVSVASHKSDRNSVY
jgi:hypothetical protein